MRFSRSAGDEEGRCNIDTCDSRIPSSSPLAARRDCETSCAGRPPPPFFVFPSFEIEGVPSFEISILRDENERTWDRDGHEGNRTPRILFFFVILSRQRVVDKRTRIVKNTSFPRVIFVENNSNIIDESFNVLFFSFQSFDPSNSSNFFFAEFAIS